MDGSVIERSKVKVTGSMSAFFHTNVLSITQKRMIQSIQTWYRE